MFDERSRYRNLPVRSFTDAGGVEVRYVARRFLPDPEAMRRPASVKVTDSDRLDLIAHRTLGDPLMFWRIADANAAMDADDLLAPAGRRLLVPSPV